MDTNTLDRIDAKLSALLAIIVDGYLRQTGLARARERSIDQLLKEAGLPASTIGALLGKTERAVNLQLQSATKRKGSRARGKT